MTVRGSVHPVGEEAVRSEDTKNITRIVLWVVVIAMLLTASFLTLLPFLSGLIWATTIAVATWPALIRLQALMRGRRSLAVATMTLVVALAFVLPILVAISTLIDAATRSPAVMGDF